MEPVEKLVGGNVAESVLRIGGTVRKPATVATRAVEALLAHLNSVGCDGAARSFGRDEAGRQVLEYVPGLTWHDLHPPVLHRPILQQDAQLRSALADLRRVGRSIRSLHEALLSFRPPADAQWDVLCAPDGSDLICHNDLAPWNLVCAADRWVFIDWDHAAPGTRLWDLAWAAISFPPVEPDCDLVTAAAKIRALCDGYELPASQYRRLTELMVERSRNAFDLLMDGARTQRLPWARLHAEGHHLYWGPVSQYIGANLTRLAELLASPACAFP